MADFCVSVQSQDASGAITECAPLISHESAHTLGAIHDCTSTTCSSSTKCCPLSSSTCDADGAYIMNPSSGSSITRFSPCTVGAICSGIGSGQVDTDCLVDARASNITSATGTCGNGIVEPGEACDCGQDACSDEKARCCDSLTCQWNGGSQCSSGDPSNDGGSWWSRNYRELIIGLTVGVGGFVLLTTLICMFIFFRKRRRREMAVPKMPNGE